MKTYLILLLTCIFGGLIYSQAPVNGLQSIGLDVGLGGTLTQSTNIDVGPYNFGINRNSTTIGFFDTTMYLAGIQKVYSNTDKLYSGIVKFGTSEFIFNGFVDSAFSNLRAFTASNSNTGIIYYKDFGTQNLGVFGFHDWGTGMIGIMETQPDATGFRYGFSTKNASGHASADFYEYDPVLNLDRKGIFVSPSNIYHKILFDISSDTVYKYSDLTMDSTGIIMSIKSQRVGNVYTNYNETKIIVYNGVFNFNMPLPVYANHLAANSDMYLLSLSFYRIAGDPAIYQK